jgi:hypothetical protein
MPRLDAAKRYAIGRAGVLSLATLLAACGPTLPVVPPSVQANPAPAMHYEIRIDVGSLPVKSVAGLAQYNIQNHQQCVQPTALGGLTDSYTQRISIHFEKDASGQFVGTLVRDPFLDSDYYGRGLCHWDVTATHYRLTGGLPTQQLRGTLREELSVDGVDRVRVDYCAAESKYTHVPPINICETDIGHAPEETRGHLFEVKTYNRRTDG